MTTQTDRAARVFHRDQLDEWGVPYDLAKDPATAPEGTAVELHHEQTGTRRWVSVHELVFRAPDDGKAYRVTYEQGLTEQQEGTDEWGDRDHVVGELVEEYDRTVKAWRRVADRPAAKPSAVVTLRPNADNADEIDLAAESHGMAAARIAYGLRLTADEFDRRALAQGDEPIPYPFSPSAALLAAARDAVPAMARAIAGQPTDARRYWIAVDVPAADVDDHLGDALAHAADRAETVLQEERGYGATAWHATEQHDAERAALIAQRDRIANDTAQALACHLAEQITALGKARGWSIWAADYIHPDREFVDTGEDTPAAPRTPAVGDRYVKRAEPDAGRIVTVNNVWTAEAGHTAVAYEWRDDKPGQCGSACPLDVFHRTYEAQQ
ncbi:hypothetical protein [Streptomyces sp. NPDC091046]|uniref:hypothetical protein n=1 Tax=Streptomyces sp. NPDC091046 TaxID=3365973 RepID=UPI00381209CF